MTPENLFQVQFASVFTFIVVLFVLYRILVSKKDATIQLLKEKNEYLAEKIEEFRGQSPDVLVEILTKRITALIDELRRLEAEKDIKQKEVKEKQKEIDRYNDALSVIAGQIMRVNEIVKEYHPTASIHSILPPVEN